MEVARRSNGFRKVAKWIVGAVVVAGAASGNVLCNEVSEPQQAELGEVNTEVNVNEEINTEVKDSKSADVNVAHADIKSKDHGNESGKNVAAIAQDVKISREPEAVGFVSSLGKEYTNREIDNLIDRTGLTGKKGVIRHMLGVRRAELLREMRKFNRILESLPEDIAVKAGAYATYDKLPADLAEKVKWSHLNTTTFGLLEKVPQNLADEMMKCDIYEGFPGTLIDKINAFLHPVDPSTVINDKEKDGKSVDGTPATPGSTEVTEEAEEREDAIKESDDSVNEGKESKEEE